MNAHLGFKIKELRERQNLFQRQVAYLLDMDTAQLSKIEKGVRQIKKEQIAKVAKILKANEEELLTLWLIDQVYAILKNENLASIAIREVTKKIHQKNQTFR